MEQRENFSYSIDAMNHIVGFDFTGRPSFEEWVSVIYAVLSDRSFQSGYGFLSDRRALTALVPRRTLAPPKPIPIDKGTAGESRCRKATGPRLLRDAPR
jgi:hypothetical protein